MTDYYLTIENQNIISEKSKSKKNGIYSFRGIKYLVKSGKAVAFRDRGKIYEPFGNFNILVGYYNNEEEAIKILKSYSK